MSFDEWMNRNALGADKRDMILKIQLKYGITHSKAVKVYNAWRKRWMRSYSYSVKRTEKNIKHVILRYVDNNRSGVALEQVLKYIELKKLGVRSNAEVSRLTGLTLEKINRLHSVLVQAGYRLQQIQELDLERLKRLQE